MNITRVEVTTNGVTVSFLEQVKVNPCPGQTTTITENRTISVREEVDYSGFLTLTLTLPMAEHALLTTLRVRHQPTMRSVNAELVQVDGTSGSQQCIDLEGEKMLSADGVRQPSHLHLHR
jgi:hypothetical protein